MRYILFTIMMIYQIAYAFDLSRLDITSLETQLANQSIRCEDVIQTALNRVRQFDLDTSRGAPLNAIVTLNQQALTQARLLDKRLIETGKTVGALHCIPTVVKDNYDTIDTPSSSGSLALLGSQPVNDAILVQRLKKAGAIIIAKTSMDEFASGLSGISSRSGRTGNALNPLLNPGGSSGGSAVAVASGFALLGMGTDNSGSIRVPAVFNGLYGLRPTQNLLSTEGIFPRGNLDGVPGPMVKSISDLKTVWSVLITENNHIKSDPRMTFRVGLIKSVNNEKVNKDPKQAILDVYHAFIKTLEQRGIDVVSVDISHFDNKRNDNTAGEVQQINQYLSQFPSTRRDFADICRSQRTLSFGDMNACLRYAQQTPAINSPRYLAVKKMFKKNRQTLLKLMQKKQIDALIMPISSKGIPTYDIASVNTWQKPLSSNSGLPALAFPVGQLHGLPVGMEIIARPHAEPTLFAIAEKLRIASRPFPKSSRSNHDLRTLSPTQFNNLKTLIGYKAFKQSKSKDSPNNLSAKSFAKLVDNILSANDQAAKLAHSEARPKP